MTENNTVDERPVVLKVEHVAKSFRLPTEQATGLKMAFLVISSVSSDATVPANPRC